MTLINIDILGKGTSSGSIYLSILIRTGYLLYTKHKNILKSVKDYLLLRDYEYLAPNTDQPRHLHHTAFVKTQKYRVIIMYRHDVLMSPLSRTSGKVTYEIFSELKIF